jgi:hypothetical protein
LVVGGAGKANRQYAVADDNGTHTVAVAGHRDHEDVDRGGAE